MLTGGRRSRIRCVIGAGGVFINYRGAADSRYAADLLYTGLSQALGPAQVFLDSESIAPGADFVATLVDRVRQAQVVLAVIGPHWLTVTTAGGRRRIDDPTDWIRRELAEAFDARVLVIPILTDGATMPVEAELPADIARLGRAQYLPLRQRYAQTDIALLLDSLADLFPNLRPTGSDTTRTRYPDATSTRVLPAAPPEAPGRVLPDVSADRDTQDRAVPSRWRHKLRRLRISAPLTGCCVLIIAAAAWYAFPRGSPAFSIPHEIACRPPLPQERDGHIKTEVNNLVEATYQLCLAHRGQDFHIEEESTVDSLTPNGQRLVGYIVEGDKTGYVKLTINGPQDGAGKWSASWQQNSSPDCWSQLIVTEPQGYRFIRTDTDCHPRR